MQIEATVQTEGSELILQVRVKGEPRKASPRDSVHPTVDAHAEPVTDWAPVYDLDARRSA